MIDIKINIQRTKSRHHQKIYGNLDYVLQSSNKPMMSFILENKKKNNRKDIKDKETHIHGIREVFDETTDSKIKLALKTSVCNGKKEYNEPEYHNMLQTKKNIMMINMVQKVGYGILIKVCVVIMDFIYPNLF